MRKRSFVTGGLIALMVLMSSNTAFAAHLHLDSDDIAAITSELRSGKPIKDVLDAHHITMGQIRSALGALRADGALHKLSNTQIATIATRLGLDSKQFSQRVATGATLASLMDEFEISPNRLHEVLDSMSHTKSNGSSHHRSKKSGRGSRHG